MVFQFEMLQMNIDSLIEMSRACGLMLCLLLGVFSEIVPLTREIANSIFTKYDTYLIYVHGESPTLEVEAMFYSYCFGDKLCAVLDPKVDQYQNILAFIGYRPENSSNQHQFIVIIDAVNKHKYILEIYNSELTQQQLQQFEYNYLYKQMEPYYSSEDIPILVDPACQQLVGKTYSTFLNQPQEIKIVYLYTASHFCVKCLDILNQFRKIAYANAEAELILFGYFDVFQNDHKFVKDQIIPYFLIYMDKNFEEPYGVEAGDLQSLPSYIEKALSKYKDKKKTVQQQDMSEL